MRQVVETPTEQGLSVGEGEVASQSDDADVGYEVADEMDWTAGRFVAFECSAAFGGDNLGT